MLQQEPVPTLTSLRKLSWHGTGAWRAASNPDVVSAYVERYRRGEDIEPIRVTAEGVIIDGHHRVLALLQLKRQDVSVVVDAQPYIVEDERPPRVPPLELRRRAGHADIGAWCAGAGRWRVLAVLLGGLQPHSSVVDVGCGAGRLLWDLSRCLSHDGHYVGFDVDLEAVAWAVRAWHDYPQARFVHHPVRSAFYAPSGVLSPESTPWPVESESADLVLAQSVFTHLNPDTARWYLRETARVLYPRGRLLATFFCSDLHLDEVSMPPGDVSCPDPGIPEAVIAYSKAWVERAAERVGLDLVEVHLGDWPWTRSDLTGRAAPEWWAEPRVDIQDIFVFERRPE